MFAPPPKINKLILKSMNCKKLIDFYTELGMSFNAASKEDNTVFYQYISDGFVFEICEVQTGEAATKNASMRFLIDEIDGYLEGLKEMKIEIAKDSWESENYQHLLINDPDGHLVELMTKKRTSLH